MNATGITKDECPGFARANLPLLGFEPPLHSALGRVMADFHRLGKNLPVRSSIVRSRNEAERPGVLIDIAQVQEDLHLPFVFGISVPALAERGGPWRSHVAPNIDIEEPTIHAQISGNDPQDLLMETEVQESVLRIYGGTFTQQRY